MLSKSNAKAYSDQKNNLIKFEQIGQQDLLHHGYMHHRCS